MKSKANTKKSINKKILSLLHDTNKSINNLIDPNKTVSNFISTLDLLNNDSKLEYKSSFLQKSIINDDYTVKSNINQRLYMISNSRKSISIKMREKPYYVTEKKIEKFQTRLIKEVKLNLENDNKTDMYKNFGIINEIKSYREIDNKQKFNNNNFDLIKKKILDKIKNCKKENFIKNKYLGNSIHDCYTTRTSFIKNYIYNNIKNKNDRKKNQIKIIKHSCNKVRSDKNKLLRNYIKSKLDISEYKTIDNSGYKKRKFDIKDSKIFEAKKLDNNYIFFKKQKKSENKNIKQSKGIQNLVNIPKNDSKNVTKKKTLAQKNIPGKINNNKKSLSASKKGNSNKDNNKRNTHTYVFETERTKMNSNNINRKRIIIGNNKKVNYSNTNMNINLKDNNIYIESLNFKKGKNSMNQKEENKNKINNNIKSKIKFKKEFEKNFNFLNLLKEKNKKIQNNKKVKETKINNNKKYDDDLGFIIDTETESKNGINIIKTNKFDVNKPKEIDMKYTLLKDNEDDEDNNNINKSKIENIIIGKIEGYKDIIETDELNQKFKLRSKSSFNIHRQMTKKLTKRTKSQKNSENLENLKSSSNKKTSFISMHILYDKNSEIENLDFDNNDYRIKGELVKIENEYEFEDMATLPFHVSKISFSKYYDNKDGKYKINQNIDTDIKSLVKINKDLTKLNDRNKNNNHKVLKYNKNIKENNKKINPDFKNNKNDNIHLPNKKNSKKKNLINLEIYPKKIINNNLNKQSDCKIKKNIINCYSNNSKPKINKNINLNDK